LKTLSDARVESLALTIADRLATVKELTVRDRGEVVRAITARLLEAFQVDATLDRTVRARIESLSRRVPEGSREWDLLYRQYLEELARRR
jgi:hypothetical protein